MEFLRTDRTLITDQIKIIPRTRTEPLLRRRFHLPERSKRFFPTDLMPQPQGFFLFDRLLTLIFRCILYRKANNILISQPDSLFVKAVVFFVKIRCHIDLLQNTGKERVKLGIVFVYL